MKIILSLLCVLTLSACGNTHIRTPGGSIRTGGYEIEIDGDHHQKNRHCPPGHAKKGWC